MGSRSQWSDADEHHLMIWPSIFFVYIADADIGYTGVNAE